METNRGLYEAKKLKITSKVSEVMDSVVSSAFTRFGASSVTFIRKLYDGRRNRAIKGGRLRDAIVMLILEAYGINEITEDHLKVIAAGEFYNIASYYENWHLDGKKEVKNEEEQKLCHISSHLFRELAAELITNTSFDPKVKLELLNEISESNKSIQIGGALEMDGLSYRELDTLDPLEHYQKYLRRCDLIAGRFYACSFALAPIMAGKDTKEIEFFRKMGRKFGVIVQIINDVGDFCLDRDTASTPDKDYQDQFNDLEKGTLTLPVYELLKYTKPTEFVGRKLTVAQKKTIMRMIIKNRYFDSSRRTTNYLKNSLVSDLSRLQLGNAADSLKFTVKVFSQSNKFYVNLREENGYIWGSQQPLSAAQTEILGKLI